IFWMFIRDNPPSPALPSEDSGARLTDSAPPPSKSDLFVSHLGVMARSRKLWLFGPVLFGVDVGLGLPSTLVPSYLNEVFDVSLEERGRMQTVALVVGCIGMLGGGFLTDLMRGWLGPKLGRSVPIALALAGCAVMMFLIPTLPTPWAVIYALG